MAGAKRAGSGRSGRQDAGDIYGDMLAEAGVASQQQQQEGFERPLKRRRAGARPGGEKAPGEASSAVRRDDQNDSDEDEEDVEFEDVALPAPTVQTMERDSDEDEDEDEDEDIQFEDVDFTAPLTDQGSATQGPKDLELNLSAETAATSARRAAERRKPITREEKERRTQIHETHLLCLLSHVARRNHWCNDAKVQEYLRPHLSDKMITYLNPGTNLSQFGRTESLKNGLQQAGTMWKTSFEITERGLRRSLWAEDPEHLQAVRMWNPSLQANLAHRSE